MTESLKVSIIIKCLNEEVKIERAVQSALDSLVAVGGEVILADARSTDRTVELAKKYPVKIVQLVSVEDRSCGAGPQLGYQHSVGEYVYILDADMIFHRDFLEAAVDFLDTHPAAAAVGGVIRERNTESLEYIARVQRNAAHMATGEVDRLDMGGLYRRSAIDAVGYLSNRLLHSYEELDLAVRLRSAGWTLHRIGQISADHFGHDKNPYALLKSRWTSRYINGAGEIVRYSLGRPWRQLLLASLKEIRLYVAFASWHVALFVCLIGLTAFGHGTLGFQLALAGILLPALAFFLKKKSVRAGWYAYVSMVVSTLGMLRGLVFSPKYSEPTVPSLVVQVGNAVVGTRK